MIKFLKIVDSDFRFESLGLPSKIINEQSIKERFSGAKNGNYTMNSLRNILSLNDILCRDLLWCFRP